MSTDAKVIPAQPEIPTIKVYVNSSGLLVIDQDADSDGFPEGGSVIAMDFARALLVAMAIVDTIKGE